jgi:hypothetical protein
MISTGVTTQLSNGASRIAITVPNASERVNGITTAGVAARRMSLGEGARSSSRYPDGTGVPSGFR